MKICKNPLFAVVWLAMFCAISSGAATVKERLQEKFPSFPPGTIEEKDILYVLEPNIFFLANKDSSFNEEINVLGLEYVFSVSAKERSEKVTVTFKKRSPESKEVGLILDRKLFQPSLFSKLKAWFFSPAAPNKIESNINFSSMQEEIRRQEEASQKKGEETFLQKRSNTLNSAVKQSLNFDQTYPEFDLMLPKPQPTPTSWFSYRSLAATALLFGSLYWLYRKYFLIKPITAPLKKKRWFFGKK